MKDTHKAKLKLVTGVDSFPFVSEGIESSSAGHVVSEDALTRIAEALENSADAGALQASAERVTELEGQLETANNARKTAEENLNTANASLQALAQRVEELEGETGIVQTTKGLDRNKKDKKPFHLSGENPMNQLADSLLGCPAQEKD